MTLTLGLATCHALLPAADASRVPSLGHTGPLGSPRSHSPRAGRASLHPGSICACGRRRHRPPMAPRADTACCHMGRCRVSRALVSHACLTFRYPVDYNGGSARGLRAFRTSWRHRDRAWLDRREPPPARRSGGCCSQPDTHGHGPHPRRGGRAETSTIHSRSIGWRFPFSGS